METVAELSIDRSGRILVPPTVQQRLGLAPGKTLVVEQGESGEVWLRLQAEAPALVDEEGILVVDAEPMGDLDDTIRRERERRVLKLAEQTGL